MHHPEHTFLRPLDKPPIAGAATAELRGDRVPLAARAQAVQDATHCAAIGHAWSSTLRAPATLRYPAFYALPQCVGNFGEGGLHGQYRSRPPDPSNLSTGFDLPFLDASFHVDVTRQIVKVHVQDHVNVKVNAKNIH